jgi:dUTPase
VSFRAIQQADLTHGNAAGGYIIYFSPLPAEATYPTIWLDLHIAGDYYHACEDDNTKRHFKQDHASKKYLRLRPREGVRLYTEERIGLDNNHTAVVTNIASRAKHGLIVAPGKIDPGFNPARLVLVVFNQSGRACKLYAGDKIASIAFAQTSAVCAATASPGHANGGTPDFETPRRRRFVTWLAAVDYAKFSGDALRMLMAAGLALLAAWFGGYLGIKKP